MIRSCRALGLETVAVYSEADANALHVELADCAKPIGPASARQSYLNIDAVIAAAREARVDAIHPGYGFLAENPRFAERVRGQGFVWIGPRPKTIEDMGDKERARLLAKAAGVPVLPGSPRFMPARSFGPRERGGARRLPAPGQGGGGRRRYRHAAGGRAGELAGVVESTQKMAERAFGDGTVYLERFMPKARHIEIQVFGFGDGHAVHLFERECSIQRRFRRSSRRAPAPGLRGRHAPGDGQAAAALAAQERYPGAGTVEFVVDARPRSSFPRDEHPHPG